MKHKEQHAAVIDSLEKDLNNCGSLGEMLSILQARYRLDGVKLTVTKRVYTGQLMTLLKTLNPEVK